MVPSIAGPRAGEESVCGQLFGYLAGMGCCRFESVGSHLVSANNIGIRQSIYSHLGLTFYMYKRD